jgi:hypothetical protein
LKSAPDSAIAKFSGDINYAPRIRVL